MFNKQTVERINYEVEDGSTIKKFHESGAIYRCIVGDEGVTAAAFEVGYYLPFYVSEHYKFNKTRWIVVGRDGETLIELIESIKKMFPWGVYRAQKRHLEICYPNDIQASLFFRQSDSWASFATMTATGVWVDGICNPGAREIGHRAGRYPSEKEGVKFTSKWVIETLGEDDVSYNLLSQYNWIAPPPNIKFIGGKPDKNYEGFWL